ncbi:MAG: hypothetical protein P4K94_03735 [Terracidiphilus sp.]|nr:hypothetical protein [Terracidiphilus sp.]
MSALVWVSPRLSPLESLCERKAILAVHRPLYGNGLQLRPEQTLVPPRQSRTDTTTADEIPVAGGSSASSDRFYDLSVKVGGIERSITYLEGHAESADKKLDSISNDVTTAMASFNTLKWIFGALSVGTWGILSALFLMWAKHYFNW